jgi:23S rRNA pseudouridine1911/1915/1917 synthase
MAPLHELQVGPEDAGERVDVWVARTLGLSRAQVKEVAEARGIRVNGRRVKRGDRLEAGAKVTLEWSDAPAHAQPAPLATPLRVLYEDAHFVGVDKPAHAPSHPLRPGETGTVANALVARFPECAEASEDAREGGLVHRLDGETSGVILAARSRDAWTAMRHAFTQRQVDKRYRALVTGPLADDGTVDLPLRHARGDRVEPAPEGGSDAREAISHFHALGRAGEYTLVEVQILTGVLHQVRAHLAAIGAPLVGDARYGGREEPGLGRFFLHARSLTFVQPLTQAQVQIESPLPEDLQAVLRKLGIGSEAG